MSETRRARPAMNVIEKILCHHAVGLAHPFVECGQIICVKADWTLSSELTFQGMETMYASIGRPPIYRPDRFWLAIDHTVDPRVNDKPKQKALIEVTSKFAKEHQLTDFWEPNTTIMHTEFARKRAQPGQIVIGADSHTCSAGGMASFATGLGAGDVVMPLVTGQTWFKIPEVVFIEFIGSPAFGIGGKDVILHILGELKRNTVAFERAVYYAGDGLQYLSDDARFAISNMTTEFGGIAGVFQADAITANVLKNRTSHNSEAIYFQPDEHCSYAAHHRIDLSHIQSSIALYPSPDNCVPVTEKVGMTLDGCFIGACTTTQEDLILGALVLQQAMLDGMKPSSSGLRRVTPGSLDIIDHLKNIGMLRIYEEAGFTVGVPSCSYCVGIGADVALENEVWLSSQNRNFRNRMGKGSIGNLASAACVAASSFTMKVTDPAPFLLKIDQAQFNVYRGWNPDVHHAALESVQFVEPDPELANVDDKDDDAGINLSSIPSTGANLASPDKVANLEAALPVSFSGKVQKFGDSIDTDAIIPAQFMGLTPTSPLWPQSCTTEDEMLGQKSFAYVRPEFVGKVAAGFNIIVAGKAFGSGSSREEAARCLKAVGITAVIAKSFAYIYARNQPNNALLGIVLPNDDFHEHAQEGAEVFVDVQNRYVSVQGLDMKFPFALTHLEENFLKGGGLKQLYKRYKNDLFRASLKKDTASGTCSSGSSSCETNVDTSW